MRLLRKIFGAFSFCVATIDRRMAIVAAVLATVFAVVGWKLVRVQLHPDKTVVAPLEYVKVVKAYRGGLFDRHGLDHPLAQTVPAFRVFVDPGEIKADGRSEVYRALARHSLCAPEKLYAAVAATRGHYKPLGETADRDVVEDLKTNAVLKRCTGIEKV